MRRQFIGLLAAAVVSVLFAASARSATLDYLPNPPGGPPLAGVFGVSGDGTVAAGSLHSAAGQVEYDMYRWTRAGGTVDLGKPLGRPNNFISDVSDDGSTIVGWASDDDLENGGTIQAFRWTPSGGYSPLGTVPGYTFSTASAVSADGSVVVGDVLRDGHSIDEGARWTAGTGMVLLPLPAGQVWGLPNDVSADGKVIVGVSSAGNDRRATRWTAAGAQLLPDMPAGRSAAWAVNGDGSVIAGTAGDSPTVSEVFRWTEAGGYERIAAFPITTGDVGVAGISADGSVIAGDGYDASGLGEGYVWDAAHGFRLLKDILNASGIDTGTTRFGISGLSADGTTVVGSTSDSRVFVAVIPEPSCVGLLAAIALLTPRWRR
jgi:uncharacterized membrane protein